MVYIFCGRIKSFSQDEKEATRRLFSTEKSKLYIDNICNRKNEASISKSLSSLTGLSCLSDYSGIDISSLSLARTDEGKPYFNGSEIKLSISHSDKYFAAAVSTACEVGIDIEEDRLSDEKTRRLASRFFSEKEQESIRLSDTPSHEFLTLWTAKEAYTKMLGNPLADTVHFDTRSVARFLHTFPYRDATVTVCTETESEKIVIFS